MVHKTNVLTHAGGLWARTFAEVAAEFPDIATEYQHVDAAAMFLVTQPQRYDVIVTDNLFGDILTDIAAAVTGGIGLAASGCINPERRFPSMFEPVHGSAPDIAGQGVADPAAAVLSVALMLDHLGHPEAARRVEQAVAAELAGRTAANAAADRGGRRPPGLARRLIRSRQTASGVDRRPASRWALAVCPVDARARTVAERPFG